MEIVTSCFVRTRKVLPATVDIAIVILMNALLIYLEFASPVKTGFYCQDPTLYHKNKRSIISDKTILLSLVSPIIVIWIVEVIFYKSSDPNRTFQERRREIFREQFYWFKYYYIGLIFKLLVVHVMKNLMGAKRPHFLETCRPDANYNCTIGTYVENYTCTNRFYSDRFHYDSSKSFPSGHASMSVYVTLFLIWYLECRVPKLRTKLVVPVIQSAFLCWSIVCCVTRVVDNRHFWWDVSAGVIIGTMFACYSCAILCKNFKKSRPGLYRTRARNLSAATISKTLESNLRV